MVYNEVESDEEEGSAGRAVRRDDGKKGKGV